MELDLNKNQCDLLLNELHKREDDYRKDSSNLYYGKNIEVKFIKHNFVFIEIDRLNYENFFNLLIELFPLKFVLNEKTPILVRDYDKDYEFNKYELIIKKGKILSFNPVPIA